MGKMTAITAEVDEETLAALDVMVGDTGQSRGALLAELARHSLVFDADLAAAAQIGIDAIERGEIVPHDEVIKEIDEMIARHRAR